MKHIATFSLILCLSTAVIALAQPDNTDMKGMDMSGMAMNQKGITYATTGVVRMVDRAKNSVTLAHEPVKSLNWPAMTMSYAIEDKALFNKLIPGKRVAFEFVKEGNKYVITSVR